MKKVLLVIGIIICVGAICFGACIGLALYNPEKYGGIFKEEYVLGNVTEEGEITSIDIELGSDKVEVLPSEDGKFAIDYYETETRTYDYSIENGNVTFKSKVKGFSIKNLFDFSFLNKPKMKIYLPENSFENFNFKIASGTVDFLKDNITANNLKIEVSSGTFNIKNINCKNAEYKLSSGSIIAKNCVASENTSIIVSSGSFTFDNCSMGNGTIDMSSGSITAKALSVNSLNVEVSSGSANLSLTGLVADYSFKGEASSGSIVLSNKDGELVNTKDLFYGNGTKSVDVSLSSGQVKLYAE